MLYRFVIAMRQKENSFAQQQSSVTQWHKSAFLGPRNGVERLQQTTPEHLLQGHR